VGANYLPSPSEVFFAFKKWAVRPIAGETIWGHMLVSLWLIIFSFFIAILIGLPLGILMGWFKEIDRIVNPIFQLIRPIPPLAWIPLAILWFGIGIISKMFVICLAAFVPSLINAYTGIKTVDPLLVNAARTFGAKQKDILKRVAIPHCLAYIFAGIRLSLTACWMTLVAAELVAASAGLGYSMQMARRTLDPPIIFVSMITIGLIGMMMIKIVKYIENKTCPWLQNT
jgi:ABC-type nitrate/sulfonate/bicarbonate transport system permease component